MTLSQARAIYKQAIECAADNAGVISINAARELKKLAKIIAKIGGFQVWEIEE